MQFRNMENARGWKTQVNAIFIEDAPYQGHPQKHKRVFEKKQTIS